MKQIVCMSTSNWHPFPTSKQHIMSRLPDCEVIYFEPPVTYLSPLKDKTAWRRFRKIPPHKPMPHVTVYSLPPVLPLYNRFRFINRFNQRKLAKYITKVIKCHSFSHPLLWTFLPTTADLPLTHSGIIYHCTDRHGAFPGQINPQIIDSMERDLCAKSNVVLATTHGLCSRMASFGKAAHYLPNGVDFERFHGIFPAPDDMVTIPRPILGFSGALQQCINIDLIRHAAASRPDWNFVLVGAALPGVDISKISRLPNVHLLGFRPYADMPNYVNNFDVCLNVFRKNALSHDVSPLKFYEYLATGKPIVSTSQPTQIQSYANMIEIADTPDDFITACEKAMQTTNNIEARIGAARAASWDNRMVTLHAILERENIF